MPHGTANARLRKAIIFKLLKDAKLNFCFQCSAEIDKIETLSIEHKIPYLDSHDPKKLFFDLDNIAFSHLKCNIDARRIPEKIVDKDDFRVKHGRSTYERRGCRCDICKEDKRIHNSKRFNNGRMAE